MQPDKNMQAALALCPLFAGIPEGELAHAAACLHGVQKQVAQNGYVLRTGDTAHRFGILLAGEVQVLREDYLGNRGIQAALSPGDLFAETFALAGGMHMPVDVVATRPSAVLLVEAAQLFKNGGCRWHTLLLQNLMRQLAAKNILLNTKLHHVTQRTTRQKVLAYLEDMAAAKGSRSFTIPLNRQQLADYLSVERSALSAELSRMQTTGILQTHRSHFTLL